jgi:tetratricopeptide (TPR) repeat protein
MFQELGPNARDLLGVVAFFPQGVDENNLDWLFPTLSNRANIFDNFCILSLTYQSNGFVTMLAPLRDYLCPNDPASSPLLLATKDRYFDRLSVNINPGEPGFEEARWIISEDVNVEHLLDVFTSIDENSVDVWTTCAHFMKYLSWHKKRLVILGPKIERLPDDHPSKPRCLFQLSRLFDMVGNFVERKRVLDHTLKLWREWGNDFQVAETLRFVSDANRLLGLLEEGIQQLNEALGIYKRLNHTPGQGKTLERLAHLLYDDKQLDAAEEVAARAINLLSDQGDQFTVCSCYRVLGNISRSKGETETAINHFETGLRIASSFNWHVRTRPPAYRGSDLD